MGGWVECGERGVWDEGGGGGQEAQVFTRVYRGKAERALAYT